MTRHSVSWRVRARQRAKATARAVANRGAPVPGTGCDGASNGRRTRKMHVYARPRKGGGVKRPYAPWGPRVDSDPTDEV